MLSKRQILNALTLSKYTQEGIEELTPSLGGKLEQSPTHFPRNFAGQHFPPGCLKEPIALTIVRAREKMAVAFSGGKDSLVGLHLALETLGQDTKVIWNNTTVEFPETAEYVQSLSKQWNLNLLVAKPKKSFFLNSWRW